MKGPQPLFPPCPARPRPSCTSASHASRQEHSTGAFNIELQRINPFYLFELKDIPQHPALVVLSACRIGRWKMVTVRSCTKPGRAFIAEVYGRVIAGWLE